jgi:ABC-type Zn uptake system ZnuABC Zn-binding protein ZnuA
MALALVGCGADSTGATGNGNDSGKILVVTTTTQLTDFARAVGGDRVDVYGVLKANVDPHDYEASPADVRQIAKAAVIVKNGVELEKWFDPTIKSAKPKGQIVDASNGVPIRQGAGNEEKAGDPHIWHNPQNAKVMVANIAAALKKADAVHAADFDLRAQRYRAELDGLDAEIQGQIATLTNKQLVTNHDAFGYYVEHFGLEFVGSIIPSFDTQAELSAQDVNDIVARIKRTGVKAVFSESSLPAKTARTIGAEAGVKVVAGENALYGDTLGPDGSAGATYLEMERHNTKEIVDNLR